MFLFNPWSRRVRIAKEYLKGLPSIKILQRLREPEDLPRLSFVAAVERYKIDAFVDVIAHASFAVELALALRLDPLLSIEEKKKLGKKGTTFGTLIRIAKEKEVLHQQDIEKAWQLNRYRNMCIHPGNSVAMVVLFYKELKNVVNKINNEIKNSDIDPLVRFMVKTYPGVFIKILHILMKYLEKIKEFPELKWTANENTLEFQKELINKYVQDTFKHLLTKKGIISLLFNSWRLINYIQKKYSYTEKVMIDALNISKHLLQTLSII